MTMMLPRLETAMNAESSLGARASQAGEMVPSVKRKRRWATVKGSWAEKYSTGTAAK